MPTVPAGPCIAGCPNRRGQCAKHPVARRSAAQRGYNGAWSARSKRFLGRYRFCGMRPGGRPPVMSRCHELGLRTPSVQTDHVVPHRGNRGLFWAEETNWQALCGSCGSRKTQAGL